MTRARIAVAVAITAYLLAVAAGPALAAETFYKAGNKVTTSGIKARIDLTASPVVCDRSSGVGGVTSKTQLKLVVKFEKCRFMGLEAKMGACYLNFSPEGTVIVEKGCTIEIAGCIVEFPSSENKSVKDVGYTNPKEKEGGKEEVLESEIITVLRKLTYKASGSSCALLLLKGGKEAEILADFVAKGMNAEAPRMFEITGAAPGTPRQVQIESTVNPVFQFANGASIKCSAALFEVEKIEISETWDLKSPKLEWKECKSEIGGGFGATIEASSSVCEYWLGVMPSPLAAPLGVSTLALGCQVTAFLGNECTIGFTFMPSLGITFTNENTTPKTVGVLWSEGTAEPLEKVNLIPYEATTACKLPTKIPALYVETGVIKAYGAGVGQVNVRIK